MTCYLALLMFRLYSHRMNLLFVQCQYSEVSSAVGGSWHANQVSGCTNRRKLSPTCVGVAQCERLYILSMPAEYPIFKVSVQEGHTLTSKSFIQSTSPPANTQP